jgi:hypothetical protein
MCGGSLRVYLTCMCIVCFRVDPELPFRGRVFQVRAPRGPPGEAEGLPRQRVLQVRLSAGEGLPDGGLPCPGTYPSHCYTPKYCYTFQYNTQKYCFTSHDTT